MIFCDTSALAKFYVPELESPAVRRGLEGEDEVYASALAKVELLGVFHRRWREGKWTQSDFNLCVRQFQKDDLSGFWRWVPLDDRIVDAAMGTFTTLSPSLFLRSSDCIHLVTALHQGFDSVYTYDAHQTLAASALGLTAKTFV
ncbi:type II toxin-antitoxin system VapC family toxin [Nibricoccus sp. IMCC34717]|uniref:type II toxin-antitoxin system VapC family toxin n=1 Tax=Nibricoccus sp. IMCC34717 TaxID=3034021 RepID=UPI0038510B88